MFWTDSWKIGASMLANGRALNETASASQSVIEHRSRTIDAALRNPLTADYGELGRMMPEKVAAFGKSGEAIVADWVDIQADLLAQTTDVMRLCLSGRVPSSAAMERIATRGARIATKMTGAFGHALAPVHDAAMANQRRLNGRP